MAETQVTGQDATILSAQRRVQDKDIIELLNVYESENYFNQWLAEVADPSISETSKKIFKRHFPRGNWLKRLIQQMTNSLPDFKVKFLGEDGKEMAKEKEAEWLQWLKMKLETPGWEGQDTFESAKCFWREMLFLTGRLAVKHVQVDENGTMIDRVQRMPQMGMYYKLSGQDRKIIEEFSFTYLLTGGNGIYQNQSTLVTERMNATEVVITETGTTKGAKPEEKGNWKVPEGIGIPVSFAAWEKLEAEPFGLPYGRRLLKKMMNILSILTDIRTANRKNSNPQKVWINAKVTDGSDAVNGAIVEVTSDIPGMPVDFKEVGIERTQESLFKELENALHDLYEDARLPFPGRDQTTIAPSSSGKALEILSAPMVEYRKAYLPVEVGFFGDMIFKMALIEGREIKRSQINIVHDTIQQKDSRARQSDSDFYASNGFIEEALRTMGVDESRIPELMKERTAAEATKAKALMQAFGGNTDPNPPEPKP